MKIPPRIVPGVTLLHLKSSEGIRTLLRYITLLEKYLTLFFCENLVIFNEARLHEATLNLHTHAWNFFSVCQ